MRKNFLANRRVDITDEEHRKRSDSMMKLHAKRKLKNRIHTPVETITLAEALKRFVDEWGERIPHVKNQVGDFKSPNRIQPTSKGRKSSNATTKKPTTKKG